MCNDLNGILSELQILQVYSASRACGARLPPVAQAPADPGGPTDAARCRQTAPVAQDPAAPDGCPAKRRTAGPRPSGSDGASSHTGSCPNQIGQIRCPGPGPASYGQGGTTCMYVLI